jgi:hypothetical protein
MVDHQALEVRVVYAHARQAEQIALVPFHEPGSANRIIVDFPWLRRGIHAQHDLIATFPDGKLIVKLKPFPSNNFAFERHRALLNLGREVEAAHARLDFIEIMLVLTGLVKQIANPHPWCKSRARAHF